MSTHRRISVRLTVVVTLLFAGCASFEPGLRYQDLARPRQPTVKDNQEGLQVSLEEFFSTVKSKQAFDADIASYGILALLLKVENGGTQTYRLQESAISAYLGNESLPMISGDRAAQEGGNSEYAGKALGWTLLTGPFAILFWPATIAGSAAHTASVNRRIEQHFEGMRFNDALLKPNQSAAGFLYFKLPSGATKLDNLKVEVVPSEDQTGQRLTFTFPIPTLNLSGVVPAPADKTTIND